MKELENGQCECPNCGKRFVVDVEAVLPEQTDLTLSLHVTPGQLMMAETLAGVLANFAKLQKAIGKEMGCNTEVFVAGLSTVDNEFRITTRIANSARGTVKK